MRLKNTYKSVYSKILGNSAYYLRWIVCALFLQPFIENCSSTGPEFNDHEIHINVDTEVTETWIELHIDGWEKYATYTVTRDDTSIFKSKLDKADTLIHDTGLIPNRSYLYEVYGEKRGKRSQIVSQDITTLDTTSQEFEISQFSFGSGYIRDVDIIDENNIWAVGSFYIGDSLYSAIYKNGDTWKFFSDGTEVSGKYNRLGSSIHAVAAIDKNNVFLFDGPIIKKWDGEKFIETLIMQDYWDSEYYTAWRTVWQTDEQTFIHGDDNGNLIFTNGYEYEFIDTGIRSSIFSICGAPKLSGDGYDIFAALGSFYELTEQNIIEIDGHTFERALNWPQDGRIFSLWFKNRNKIFVSKYNPIGIATYGPDKKWTNDSDFKPPWIIRNIKGNDINDIWATGEQHYTAHFNGIRWKNFPEIERFGPLCGMDVKGNIMVAGGYTASLIIVKRK